MRPSRSAAAVAIAVAVAVLSAACSSGASTAPSNASSPSAAGIALPSVPPTPTPSAPAATEPPPTSTPPPAGTPAPRPAPSVGPVVFSGFQYSDILRVEVNGLAVREEPSLDSPLMQGQRLSGGSAQALGDVRLDAGDFVSVHLGPLPIGDVVWYQVWPAEDARLMFSTINWNAGSATAGSGSGWVAGSVAGQEYLTLHRRPDVSEIEQYMPVGVTVSGSGAYESAPQARHDIFAASWAVAGNSDGTPCSFSVTLRPEDGSAPFVVVETATGPGDPGPLAERDAFVRTPWDPFAEAPWDSFTVSIAGDCPWAFRMALLGHD